MRQAAVPAAAKREKLFIGRPITRFPLLYSNQRL